MAEWQKFIFNSKHTYPKDDKCYWVMTESWNMPFIAETFFVYIKNKATFANFRYICEDREDGSIGDVTHYKEIEPHEIPLPPKDL